MFPLRVLRSCSSFSKHIFPTALIQPSYIYSVLQISFTYPYLSEHVLYMKALAHHPIPVRFYRFLLPLPVQACLVHSEKYHAISPKFYTFLLTPLQNAVSVQFYSFETYPYLSEHATHSCLSMSLVLYIASV